MTKGLSAIDRLRLRRMRRFWQQRLKAGDQSQDLLEQARNLRRLLDQIERQTASSVAPAEDPKAGLPNATRWADRPAAWSVPVDCPPEPVLVSGTQVGPLVSLYHDASETSAAVLQSPSPEHFSSAYQISIDVGTFDGTYLSIALGLPKEEIEQIRRTDLIRLDLTFTALIPVTAMARANVKIGPNIETIVREVDQTRATALVEFDLFYAELDTETISDVWVDVIFERPAGNVITVRDLRLSRRPRAQS